MFGWDDLAAQVFKVIDKVVPDPQAAAAQKLKVLELKQAGEFKDIEAKLQEQQMQVDVNKVEAASPSLFVSGWRPAAGWICVGGLAYSFLGQPILTWLAPAFHLQAAPILDLGSLITMLGGMLGLGAIRMTEKLNGVARVQ